MKNAEFEEREYEAPLYNQLERGSTWLWSPGQVFEHHIGIDRAMFISDDWLFRMHGYATYAPGAVLTRYRWPDAWFGKRGRGRLPNFYLNLFVQAKRPLWGKRAPKSLENFNLHGPVWKFDVTPHQQRALEVVAQQLADRALVVYAAPAFHLHQDLFKHTRFGTIAEHSCFPSVMSLQGHSAWYYNCPGAVGIASSVPRPIEEASLDTRLQELARGYNSNTDNPADWRLNLRDLASGIVTSLSTSEIPDSSRLAYFFDLQREAERDLSDIREGKPLGHYQTVLNFLQAFATDWYVVGETE
ncbi:MAG: hypothetical protein U1E22_03240 [Coriobacteriia bacterium]|nr:hypothetical protein [Coriobacteriia bacterium]